MIPYVSDEQAEASTKNAHFKLVCRLVKFHVLDDSTSDGLFYSRGLTRAADADELEWYVPAAVLPSDLQTCLNVINQYLESPLDLEGKTAGQLLRTKARRRARRRARSSDGESDASDEEQPRRRARKKKEEVQYKSAQFIEDSDAELGDDAAFFAKEAALRARTAMAAREGRPGTMKAAGTKKRRKRREGEGGERKRWKGAAADDVDSDGPGPGSPRSAGRSSATPDKPRARPRPKPRFGVRSSSVEQGGLEDVEPETARSPSGEEEAGDAEVGSRPFRSKAAKIVVSDDEV